MLFRSHLTVALISMDGFRQEIRAFVHLGGSFEIAQVRLGSYRVEVRTQDGEVIHTSMASVASIGTELNLQLKPREPSAMGSISVSRLVRDPDGRASREYAIAGEYLKGNNLKQARKHFEKALKTDPAFPEAHTELGVVAYRCGEASEAKAEFARAVELDPGQFLAWSNLASIHFAERDFAAAESTAMRGLQKSPNVPKATFYRWSRTTCLESGYGRNDQAPGVGGTRISECRGTSEKTEGTLSQTIWYCS